METQVNTSAGKIRFRFIDRKRLIILKDFISMIVCDDVIDLIKLDNYITDKVTSSL